MSRTKRITRTGLLLVLCLIAVASLVFTGCGSKKEAALQKPGLEFTSYNKGSTVDFDDTTLNSMADGGGEAAFKYNIMKAIYPTIWNSNKDAVAQALFPAPYWKGDGVHTYYSYLISADQTAVDGTIFATKLSAAEQQIVLNSIESFFALYDDEVAAAKPLSQNTAYMVLYGKVSATAATTWQTEATAWMAALNSYASSHYSGKTYAQLTYVERKTVEGIVFANGAGTINPEYSLWRAMVQTSFRNGNASARWPDKRDALTATMYPGKTYSQLDCVQGPTVDGAVWASCNTTEQQAVTNPSDPAKPGQIEGLWNLATEQVNGVTADNMNVYVYALSQIPGPYLTSGNATIAIGNWLTDVTGTTPGTTENTSFYDELLYGPAQWKSALALQYFGTDNYSALSTASQAVVDQADAGMMSLSVAQRSDTMALSSNIIYQTLQYRVGSATAAAGWATDVGAGMNRELALYKWMAYEAFRNGTAVTFYPTQLAEKMTALYPTKTYTALTSCEQGAVNAAVWAALGTGEQDYGTTAVSGMWGKVQAEMTDGVAINQTTLSMALRSTGGTAFSSETAATNFKADVESGMSVRQAFYRWLAKESVKQMGSAALLVRESVGEFYIKITNPNEYDISIDRMMLYFRTTAGASSEVIDGAKQVVEDIWVPAKTDDQDGEVTLKVLAPTKAYDLVSWLAMEGVNTNTALAMATEVFDKIQAGTVVWTVQADVQVSHTDEIQNYTYTLTQT
jgi:hypothetical protein